MKVGQGYVRTVSRENPAAVRWWYCETRDDGFVFARGGRCRTSREARRLLREARERAIWEREQEWRFIGPQFVLSADGELVPIP